MMLPPTASGFGLNQMTQNILQDGMSRSNMFSLYNNGFTRLNFNVMSQLPTELASTNFQAREFNNMNMVPVLQYLDQNGQLVLPQYMYASPDNIPTMSQLTNWGGNSGVGIDPYTSMPVTSLGQPQVGMPGGGYAPMQPAGYPPMQPAGYPPAQPAGYPPMQPTGYPPMQPAGYPPMQPAGYPPAQPMGYPPAQPYPTSYPQLYPAQAPSYPGGLTPISTLPGQPPVFMAPPIFLGGPPPMMGQFPMQPPGVMMAPPIFMPPPQPMMAPPMVITAPPIFMR